MEKLRNIFISVLGISGDTLSLETAPANTPSWDSLNAIVLVSEIEKAFDVRFDYDEVMTIKNFGDVVAFMKDKGINIDES